MSELKPRAPRKSTRQPYRKNKDLTPKQCAEAWAQHGTLRATAKALGVGMHMLWHRAQRDRLKFIADKNASVFRQYIDANKISGASATPVQVAVGILLCGQLKSACAALGILSATGHYRMQRWIKAHKDALPQYAQHSKSLAQLLGDKAFMHSAGAILGIQKIKACYSGISSS